MTVLEGKILASNAHGQVTVNSGESANAEAGKAPTVSILLNPRDAVQWALYYPPVLAAYGTSSANSKLNLPAYVQEAMQLTKQGETSKAFSVLDKAPDKERNATYYVYRAALYLSVGRIDKANLDIDRALKIHSVDSNAQALKSIIALTQNDTKKALAIAQQAVDAVPGSATALIALSYAQQAEFDLTGAQSKPENSSGTRA